MSNMADGPTPAKTAKLAGTTLPECPYGARCYRKNPQHFKEFSHNGGSSSSVAVDSVSASSATKATTGAVLDSVPASPASKAALIKTSTANDTHLPPCKYGIKCYRKNLLHFAEFSHPTSDPSKADDGNDTDVYDSDEDKTPSKKADGEKKDILSKELSLVKRFSQLTDEERKDLIKRALEEKHRLQQELDGAKKIVEEKNKKLQLLQKQVNNGLLMLEGEEEALKKTETTYFPLYPERAYKEGSASQIHFRLAESQFYRLVTGDSANQIRVTKVEYVVSPKVVKRFREYQEKLKKERGEELSYSVLGFHGTEEKNIKSICEHGFRTPGDSSFHHRTDTGYYGAGVYFSEYPTYSMAYIQGGSKLMLCQVLAGKVYKCKNLIMGSALMKGYDSHMSPCKKELVIFHSAAILPCYIIYFTNAKTAFTYTAKVPGKPAAITTPGGEDTGSNCFEGLVFALTGKLSDTQANIFDLIEQHGGSKGTKSSFNILVASDDSYEEMSEKVRQASKKSVPIVYELYIHDCIKQKKQLPTDAYIVTD